MEIFAILLIAIIVLLAGLLIAERDATKYLEAKYKTASDGWTQAESNLTATSEGYHDLMQITNQMRQDLSKAQSDPTCDQCGTTGDVEMGEHLIRWTSVGPSGTVPYQGGDPHGAGVQHHVHCSLCYGALFPTDAAEAEAEQRREEYRAKYGHHDDAQHRHQDGSPHWGVGRGPACDCDKDYIAAAAKQSREDHGPGRCYDPTCPYDCDEQPEQQADPDEMPRDHYIADDDADTGE